MPRKAKQQLQKVEKGSSDSELELAENEFIVEKIIDEKREGRRTLYFIKWEGYPMEESTWEPLENIKHCTELLDDWAFRKAKKLSLAFNEEELSDQFQSSKEQTLAQRTKSQKEQETRPDRKQKSKESHLKRSPSQTQHIGEAQPSPTKKGASPNKSALLNEGSFKSKDKVDFIIGGRLTLKGGKERKEMQVSWEKRSNGVQPCQAWVKYEDVKKHAPEQLLQYYESYANSQILFRPYLRS